MIHRICVESWYYQDRLRLWNGDARKLVIQYMPKYEPEDRLLVQKLSRQRNLERGIDDLAKLALVAGPYATLWAGDMEGKIVPMDVEPQGWTYANGEPVEPSWFWQWHPSDATKAAMLQDLKATNPLSSTTSIFKSLAPRLMCGRHGAVTDIQAIDVAQLPNIVKSGTPYIFEFEG